LSYHIAYTTTGDIVDAFGLDALAPYVGGETAFSAIESTIHWGIRGVTDNLPNSVIDFIENPTTNLTSSGISGIPGNLSTDSDNIINQATNLTSSGISDISENLPINPSNLVNQATNLTSSFWSKI